MPDDKLGRICHLGSVPANVQDARRIINELRVEQKLTPPQPTTTLRESVNAHRPVPSGNVGTAFTHWATRSLTPDELARTRHIERVYERTATLSGALQSSGSAGAINSLRGP